MMNSVNDRENAALTTLKTVLEQVVRTIVNKPELVRIEIESKSDGKQLLTIQADDKDLGKVIGKNGQTIKSIRGLINAINPSLQDVAVDVSM